MKDKITKTDAIKLIFQNDEDFEVLDEEVMHALISETVSKDVNRVHEERFTLGDRLADKLAEFAGSWFFISSFIICLLGWIALNAFLLRKPYDPYPFILLNLVLSCIAAIQAPVIMMSQNRQEEKDRIRAQNDYRINLKSELIVEDLHYKIDKIIENQNQIMQRLNEIEKRF